MTVKKLIEKLKEFPEDMGVWYDLMDGWGGENEVTFVEIDKKEDTRDKNGNMPSPIVKIS